MTVYAAGVADGQLISQPSCGILATALNGQARKSAFRKAFWR